MGYLLLERVTMNSHFLLLKTLEFTFSSIKDLRKVVWILQFRAMFVETVCMD